MSKDLANCFLEKYPELVEAGGSNVIVDLTDCETSRGGIAALPLSEVAEVQKLTLKFMVPRPVLDCLKKRLEEPGLALNAPVAIDLTSCG